MTLVDLHARLDDEPLLFASFLAIIMREPLENITIGNFLYGLGLSLGARAGKNAPSGCVNLLQQGPLDPPLGDVLLHFPSVVRLFEFKRGSANKQKERAKLVALQAALSSEPHLQAVSREIHWYVETHDGDQNFHFGAKPYLDMRERNVAELSMESMVNGLVDDVIRKKRAARLEMVQEYLRTVTTFAGEASGTYSGLLIAVGEGGIRYVAVENVRDLRYTAREHRLFMRLEYERRLELERTYHVEMEHAMKREVSIKRQYERSGPSFGFGDR